MIPNHDIDNLRTSNDTHEVHDLNRTQPNSGSAIRLSEPRYITDWPARPTQHMTATWGD
jgi:hypothetical protein